MVRHFHLSGWRRMACGLPANQGLTGTEAVSEIECKSCKAAIERGPSLHAAWVGTSTVLRFYYLQRAGLGVREGGAALRSAVEHWSPSLQKKMTRQLQSNPEGARRLLVPVADVKFGGPDDKRRDHAREWDAYRAPDQCCPYCGRAD